MATIIKSILKFYYYMNDEVSGEFNDNNYLLLFILYFIY